MKRAFIAVFALTVACAICCSTAHAQLIPRGARTLPLPTVPKVNVPVFKAPTFGEQNSSSLMPYPATAQKKPALQKKQVYTPTQQYTAKGRQVFESKQGNKAYVDPNKSGQNPNHVLKSPNGTQIFKPTQKSASGGQVYKDQNGQTFIAPAKPKVQTQQSAKAAADARFQEGMDLYNKVNGNGRGVGGRARKP